MDKKRILEKIRKSRIIPVIRSNSPDEARRIIQAILAGGISILEITMTTPNAVELIEECVKRYGDKSVIGAGTVVDFKTARKCFDAGATFIVSPIFERETVEFCTGNQTVIIPGAVTPTEIFRASSSGADAVKIFPISSIGGAAYLKAVKSVFPETKFITTGGVNLHNFDEYLDAGAFAVGIGNDLSGGSAREITERCKNLSSKVNAVRQKSK